jgi:hypothetical protein
MSSERKRDTKAKVTEEGERIKQKRRWHGNS